MRKTIITLLVLFTFFSCGTYLKTKDGYKIRGKSKIVFHGLDKTLNEKSKISGFVYSQDSKEFLISANVKVGKFETTTNENGFFEIIVKSGVYDISTKYLGNTEQKIEGFKLKKNTSVIIVFELGTEAIY